MSSGNRTGAGETRLGRSEPSLRLRSGEPVTDRADSHLPPALKALLPEILSRIRADQLSRKPDGSFELALDLGRTVGETICVETGPDDEVVFAQRPGRAGLTRFVKGRAARPCSSVVVVLRPARCGGFFVVTSWFGSLSRPEPWDRNARRDSVAFWLSHALVWGSTQIVPGTETTECPHCVALPSVSRRWPVCVAGHAATP